MLPVLIGAICSILCRFLIIGCVLNWNESTTHMNVIWIVGSFLLCLLSDLGIFILGRDYYCKKKGRYQDAK